MPPPPRPVLSCHLMFHAAFVSAPVALAALPGSRHHSTGMGRPF